MITQEGVSTSAMSPMRTERMDEGNQTDETAIYEAESIARGYAGSRDPLSAHVATTRGPGDW